MPESSNHTTGIARSEITAMELIEKELGHALNISAMMTKGVVEATDKASHSVLAIELVMTLYPQFAEVLTSLENVVLMEDEEGDDIEPMTPTEIGAKLQLTARMTNKLLLEKGFQKLNDEKGKGGNYIPTAKGAEWAIIKGNSIKWYPSVLAQIKEDVIQ